MCGPHKLVGTSPGFIPKNLNAEVYNEIIQIADEEALTTMKNLARQEGLLVGPSSGASVYAAIMIAKRLGAGKKFYVLHLIQGTLFEYGII